MSMTSRFNACFFILFSVALVAQAIKIKVTPMDKVISLLKDLSGKLAAQGKQEAAEYDKYACFCKEQADQKQHEIETSEANHQRLNAQIEQSSTERAGLESEIMKLNQKASDLEEQAARIQDERDHYHERYLSNAKDMNEAIDSCAAAVKTIKDSKTQMLGAKLDLMQVTHGLTRITQRLPLVTELSGAVALLSKLKQKAAPKYEFQSNEIMETLQQLSSSFGSMKESLDLEEHKANSMFETTRLGLLNQKGFAEKEQGELEALAEVKTEELQAAKVAVAQEENDMFADRTFLHHTRDECEDNALLFDDRSQTRAAELTAIAKATATLEDGAAPNYAAIPGLVGLQTHLVSGDGMPGSSPVTLVQLQSKKHEKSRGEAVLQRVQSLLAEAADRIDSRVLSNIAVRVKNPSRCRVICPRDGNRKCYQSCPDTFANVRGMIKDLLEKLGADMDDEMTQKAMCDKAMNRTIAERDSASNKTEVANGHLDMLQADQRMFEDDTVEVTKQLSELRRALLEANKLYAEEAKIKTEAIANYEQGITAVTMATTLLTDFYSTSLVQVKSHTSQESETSATGVYNTVGGFGGVYHGAKAESQGIIGILDVILADFRRSKDATTGDLEEAGDERARFETETKAEIKMKLARIEKNTRALAETKGLMLNQEQDVKDNKKFLENAESALDIWKADCVQGETWEERKQKRDDEIQALKQAHGLLEDWQQ